MMTRRHSAALASATFILGALIVHWLPHGQAQGDVRAPSWKYGMNTRVRKGSEADFNSDTKKIGIEVYRDDNNGNLIYITETGSIAVVPGR